MMCQYHAPVTSINDCGMGDIIYINLIEILSLGIHFDIQYIPRNMHTVLLCFALLWLCDRS